VIASTPRWAAVVREIPCALRCYDYIDHVAVHAGPTGDARIKAMDEELLRLSDLVTAVSEPLCVEVAARFDPNRVFLVPNAVPGEWLEKEMVAYPRSKLVRDPRRTLAGFVGSLFEWIDIDLLVEAARRAPDVEFVLVGPTRRRVSMARLYALPNVRRFPPVPFSMVPSLVLAFDVCLIPFKKDVVSACADPLKLYEYCALGKPVVSTVPFTTGGTPAPITVAATPAAFVQAIQRSIVEDSEASRRRRVDFARAHTWQRRAQQFLQIVEGQLAARRTEGRSLGGAERFS